MYIVYLCLFLHILDDRITMKLFEGEKKCDYMETAEPCGGGREKISGILVLVVYTTSK